MGEKTRFFELKTVEGQIILSFNLVEKVVEAENNPSSPQTSEPGGNGGKEFSNAGNNDSPMTEAQKRYLFRILAEHGIQGEIAHQELKNAFRVNQLTQVTKFEASKLIERLLADGTGGLKNGSPIQ
jgi:hypothetical protein